MVLSPPDAVDEGEETGDGAIDFPDILQPLPAPAQAPLQAPLQASLRSPTPQPPTTFVRALPLPPREILPPQLAVLSRRLRYPAAQRLRFLIAMSVYMHYPRGGDLDQVVREYQIAVEAYRDVMHGATLRAHFDDTIYSEMQPFEARTVGGQRLEALALLRDGLWNMNVVGKFTNITDSVLLEILEHFRWVVENAAAWIVLGGDIDQITDRIADLRTPNPTQFQQDERWARFITMTSTNSHYSAQQFLADRQYDYAAALNDWARLGHLPLVEAPPATTPSQKKLEEAARDRVLGLRIVIANHESENGEGQPVAPLDGAIEGSEIVQRQRNTDEGDPMVERNENDGDLLLPEEDEPAWKDDARPSYSRSDQTGFLIDPDTTPPILGYTDPTKFHIERIIKGKYAFLTYARMATMDWDSAAHIKNLRKWRNEEYGKITRVLKRLGAVAYIRAEVDFLYFEEARHFEHAFRSRMRKIHRTNPAMTLREARLRTMAWFDEVPSHYKMSAGHQDKIMRRFNKKFAGKTVVDGVTISDDPRPERSSNSLNQQRHRSRMICRDFTVSYQPARGPRDLPTGRTDDEDSDYKNHRRHPRPWVQPSTDSDDTVTDNESSDPESPGDGGEVGGDERDADGDDDVNGSDGWEDGEDDTGDDDDDDEGGDEDGATAQPAASTRRITRQSQRLVNAGVSSSQAGASSSQAVSQGPGISAGTVEADDAIMGENGEEENWSTDSEGEDEFGDIPH
jgi:hypothetical protein